MYSHQGGQVNNDRFYSDIRRYEQQRVWREIRRDVWLMVLCALAAGVLVGQVL